MLFDNRDARLSFPFATRFAWRLMRIQEHERLMRIQEHEPTSQLSSGDPTSDEPDWKLS